VEVVVVPGLELEGHVRRFEEGQEGAVAEAVEGVQHARLAAALGLADLQRARERQPQEAFVEAPRLL
jgi:hypothetical protein